MSYFPEDIPFMSEEERKANGIKTAKEIETLKMQLSKKDATFDSVRRQQVIDRIEWWFKILKQNSDILIDAIKTLPPTHLESHWIPCSERLPEKYGNYLVTTDDGEVDIGSCDPENKDRQDHFWSGCDADGFFWYGENIVIAWMKLPEPYQGEGEQDDRI